MFGQEEWTFTRGALQTVDRSFGFFGNMLSKHVTDGHIIHHFFSTQIPHYNLMQATEVAYKVFDEKKVAYMSPKVNIIIFVAYIMYD